MVSQETVPDDRKQQTDTNEDRLFWLGLIGILVAILFIFAILILYFGLLSSSSILKSGNRPKGSWAQKVDKYMGPLKCLANIIEDNISNIDRTTSCCRFEALNTILLDKSSVRCPHIESDELFSLFALVTPYIEKHCHGIDTDTFSCQMMFVLMNEHSYSKRRRR